ncbi:hypothetical protein ACQPZJ_37385 [Actinoplanes sp. CA-054009]
MLSYVRRLGRAMPARPQFLPGGTAGDLPLSQARERVRHGDWRAARDVLADAGEDWALKGRRLGVLAEDDAWLVAWLEEEPSDPAAVLLDAATLEARAWAARGFASAARTSAEQGRTYHELSAAAAKRGLDAMALAGARDPLPWIEMMSTLHADREAMAVSFDELYAEGRRRDPYNFDLHVRAVSLRCQKWFGSHESMFATAREAADGAPGGSSVVLLPLFAHFEYAMREFLWDTRAERDLKVAQRYFRRAEVVEEADRCIAQWRGGTPDPVKLSTCLQWVALFYTLSGRRKQARAVFAELGQHVAPASAWALFFPGEQYGYLKSWLSAHNY